MFVLFFLYFHSATSLERTAGIPAAHLDVQRYQLELPGLIVQAEDDRVVPVGETELIHAAWFDSQLLRLPADASVCWVTR